jgi:nuclear pore complex protein Nup54
MCFQSPTEFYSLLADTRRILFVPFDTAPATGGFFGSTAPVPAAGGLFSTSTPSSTGLWSAAAAPPLGGFGGPPQQSQQMMHANPHQSAMHAHQNALQRQETARMEKAIFHLHSSYSPYAADPMNLALASNSIPSSLYAFTAILYDPLPPEHRTQGGGQLSVPKPMHISNQVWNEALARNPDPRELMPVALVGAAALHCRIVSQQEKVNVLATHAEKLRENLQFLERIARLSKDGIQNSNAEHEALRRRLLEIMRKVEIIRCMGQPIQHAEVEAQQRLGEIIKKVNIIGESLSNLEELGKQQARAWRMRGETIESRSDFGSLPLREEDKVGLFHVLNDQMLGMERLGRIVNRDVRDVGILKNEMNKTLSSKENLLPSVGVAIFGVR